MNKKAKNLFLLIVLFAMCALFASDRRDAYLVLEQALFGVLGVIVGGVVAALAFIFTLIVGVGASRNLDESKQNYRFTTFTESLKGDVQLLILMFFAAVALPYIRYAGLPYFYYPADIASWISRDRLFTAAELWVLIVSALLLFEIVSCMFQVLIFRKIADIEEKEG